MQEIIVQFIPLLLLFFVGYGLKRIDLLTPQDGSTIFRLLFYIGLPAMILSVLSSAEISLRFTWLAVLPAIVISLTLCVLWLLRKNLLATLDYRLFTTIVAGTIILNTGFLIPIVEQFYGSDGLARLLIIDVFNGVLMISLVYAVILRLGKKTPNNKHIIEKLLVSPVTWAAIVAIVLNITQASLPGLMLGPLEFITRLVGPLILIGLGLKFTPRPSKTKDLLVALGLRFGLGAIIGLMFVYLTGLDGLNAQIAVLACMAPIGFNSITFSETEKLDTEFATTQVSAGLILAFLSMPGILYVLNLLFPL